MSDNTEVSTWVEAIEKTKERFLQIAPTEMKFETEKGFAIQLLKNNEFLMKVAAGHPVSLQQAITNVAAIGLSLNPAEKLAYLIPRTISTTINNKKVYQQRIFLEPSYMGMIRLATDSGSIKWVQAYPVYDKDEFVFNGAGEKPTHKFNAFSKDRGDFVGVYCVAKTADQDHLVNIMDVEKINSIRDRSEAWKSNQSGPWKTDYIEQAKKTVIRQAFKTWPRTDLNRLAMAVDLSNENEGLEPILTSPNIGEFSQASKDFFDSLIEKNDALGMYIFQTTANESNEHAFTSLYHSFEKGQKGKYQRIIDGLIERGYNIVCDIRLELAECLSRDDSHGAQELLSTLDKDALNVVLSGIEPSLAYEARKIIDQVQS